MAFFTPGRLTILLDAQAGSSGKGRVGAYVCQQSADWTFACNAFMPNAGHTVQHRDGRKFFYKTFNSCAAQHDRYEALYIGPGAVIDLRALYREMIESDIPPEKVKISPVATILQGIDAAYERGQADFEGNPIALVEGGPLAKSGSTAAGCGAARARKVLRHSTAQLARDVPDLRKFLADVPGEIMRRLDRGESGLLEIAQGFQLSNSLPEFHPHCTSRNCTVAAGLDDMMIPPFYAGNVILNLRTYPIRTCSNKYVDRVTGKHLTEEDIRMHRWGGDTFATVEGNTGPGYPDQREIDWSDVTAASGSPEQIRELSSVTKLPRRVFTFSKQNLQDAIRYNQTAGQMMLFVNFMDYVDHDAAGLTNHWDLSTKCLRWLRENIGPHLPLLVGVGTGPCVEDMIAYKRGDLKWTSPTQRSTATPR